ncbi:GDSL esterase/lipase At5g42170-like [Rhodamnia argentea]|uniref:GDSL esterase/lipase At5g42170-like n=1 Tax=Rhodamnia argentea TaxID=178133 RepID=A0A8B8Q313_9MYRT|nr:GDSL esterase/lipase At5g42170-like [Rhodamnia argentea]
MFPILAQSLIPLSLSLLMQICTPQAEVVVLQNATVSAVFTFGDSILDTGNNNHLITLVKSNFPPYGRHFMGGKPTGRFSNGMIPSDFFARQLGIKELLPAFLDPNLQLQALIGGINFASAGAGFDPLTSELVSVIPMSTQLRLFDEYKTKLKSSIGEERADSIVANGLYIVSAGSNDIAATYLHTPTRIFNYSIPSYTELLVRSASSFLQELHIKGARRIGVFSLSPLGCTPLQRTLASGIERRCAEDDNRMAQLFNSKLSLELHRLNGAFPHAKMALVDAYGLLLDIMKNPAAYGFEISDRGCCGSGLIETGFMCSQWDFLTCSNASGHVFWDAFHPTENAYRILVQGLLGKLLVDLYS